MTPEELFERARCENRKVLTERESKLILGFYEVPVTKEVLATSFREVEEALETIPFPVAMKVESPGILHKTEAGVVRLNVRTREEARKAYDDILRRATEVCAGAPIKGVLIQEMVTDYVAECIVGVNRDEQFGPVVMVGLGGIFVELFQDISLRVCPVTSVEAMEMIGELRALKVLQGFRGRPRADVPELARVISKLSEFALTWEEQVAEVDINPLMIFGDGKGVCAVDALIVLRG